MVSVVQLNSLCCVKKALTLLWQQNITVHAGILEISDYNRCGYFSCKIFPILPLMRFVAIGCALRTASLHFKNAWDIALFQWEITQ